MNSMVPLASYADLKQIHDVEKQWEGTGLSPLGQLLFEVSTCMYTLIVQQKALQILMFIVHRN